MKNTVRAWREYRGMTQGELAERIGTATAVISLLENGKRALSDKWLYKLADALDTRPGHLLDHDPNCRVKDDPALDAADPNGEPNHLRAWREFRRLSQSDLAELAGTSDQVIGHLERGRTKLSAEWLRRLAPALGTTPGRLLDHHPTDLDDDVLAVWRKIAAKDRPLALRVLAAFIKRST